MTVTNTATVGLLAVDLPVVFKQPSLILPTLIAAGGQSIVRLCADLPARA